MITDQDINKLAKVFATKEDLKGFATKEDLKDFATKKDLMNLEQVFVTKPEFNELKSDVADIKDTVSGIATAVDLSLSRTEALNQEFLILSERDSRYQRWFDQLAQKVGVTLTP